MSIRRAARQSFGHEHSNAIVIGGWALKLLALLALVAGIKWVIDLMPADVDWMVVAGVAAGVLLAGWVLRRLFRPRIRY